MMDFTEISVVSRHPQRKRVNLTREDRDVIILTSNVIYLNILKFYSIQFAELEPIAIDQLKILKHLN